MEAGQRSEGSRKQHVVAVPFPAQGHLNPLLRFCHLLASHGLLVTFVNIDPVHRRIEELKQQQQQQQLPGAAAQPAQLHAAVSGLQQNITFAHVPIYGLDLSNNFRVSFQPFLEAQNSIASHLELLILRLSAEGPAVTCILSDIGMTTPTQNVADKLNIPRIVFFPSSASFLLLHVYAIQGDRISTTKVLEAVARMQRTGADQSKEVICEGLLRLPTIYNNDLPHYKHVVDDTHYVLEFVVKACERSIHYAHAIAINSFEDLEAPAFMALSKHLSLPIYGVGPFVEPLHKKSSTTLWKEDEACIHWLDQQPPLSVLYISFGSITLLSQAQFQEMVAGLLSSQQRFLWVCRSDLIENVDQSSSCSSLSWDSVLRGSQGKGYVVDWAPQVRVLAHPSVGGFLTHCGWNSTLEAIANGVPMLCWPYFADQLLDAKYVVEEWRVGLRFEATRSRKQGEEGAGPCLLVERGEVERVIRALMVEGEESKVLRENALRLKEAASLSLQPGNSSYTHIQSLVNSLCMWISYWCWSTGSSGMWPGCAWSHFVIRWCRVS